MRPELKQILTYIFGIVLTGILLSLGLDFITNRIDEDVLEKTPQSLDLDVKDVEELTD